MEELTKEEIWKIAEEINKSDGVIMSDTLKKLVEKEINNEITTEEIINELKKKYEESSEKE